MKCGTSGILPVSRREQNEVDDFSKSTSRLKSTNRNSFNVYSCMTTPFSAIVVEFKTLTFHNFLKF